MKKNKNINKNNNDLFLLIDTETAGSLQYPLCYDVSFLITDKQGNIYTKRKYLVREVFYNTQKMASAYYNKKIPFYLDGIANGSFKLLNFSEIIDDINTLLETFNVKYITAYNINFDLRVLKNTSREYLHREQWCTCKVEPIDLWSGACQIIFNKKFIKEAIKNQWLTANNNICTNAETCYKYISKDYNFKEHHTGYEDCKIENAILKHLYHTNKPFKPVLNNPWQIVAKIREEMEE